VGRERQQQRGGTGGRLGIAAQALLQQQGLHPTVTRTVLLSVLLAVPLAGSQPVDQDQGRQGILHGLSLQGSGSLVGRGAGKVC
jgi:hypothetical protein